MKFKKVQISAFRIYNTPSDSTFNLTINSGEPADFVSLYAPNGFGKTSFYDAVEWGVTNDIQRFWQNSEITNEAISALREINDEKQLRLLRNRDASNDLETSVKIETDGFQFPERKFYVHGNSGSDIKSMGELENASFQQVILSQEWISAFLKESKGDKRYEKFMENPQLKGLDEYYKKVKSLVATCEKYSQELNHTINEQKKNIAELSDDRFLDTVNDSIYSLIQRGESLELVTLKTTTKDVLDFTDMISGRLFDLQQRIVESDKLIANIQLAKSGSEKLPGLDLYYENLTTIANIDKELVFVNSLLEGFRILEKSRNDLTSKVDQRNKLIDQQNVINELTNSYSEYHRIYTLIQEKRKVIEDLHREKAESFLRLSTKRNEESDLKVKHDSLLRDIADIKREISEIPNLNTRYLHLKDRFSLLDSELNWLKEERDRNLKLKGEAELYIDRYTSVISILELRNFSITLPEDSDIDQGTLLSLAELNQTIVLTEQNLIEIEERLKGQQEFNSSLQEFVERGIEIVNLSKTSNCPLCTQTYDSYSALALRIANNRLFSVVLQDLLKKKSELQDSLLKHEESYRKNHKELIDACDIKIAIKRSELDALAGVMSNIDNSISSNERTKEDHLKDLLVIEAQTKNLEITLYEERLKHQVKILDDEISVISQALTNVSSDIRSIYDQGVKLSAIIDNAKKDIESYTGDKNYTVLINWFRREIQDDFGEKNLLTNNYKTLSNFISDLAKATTALNQTIASKQVELAQYTVADLNIQKEANEILKSRSSMVVSTYSGYLKSQLDLSIDGMELATAISILNEKEIGLKSDIQTYASFVNDYSKLIEFSKNLSPFLQSEEAKALIKAAEEDLKFLSENVRPKIEGESDRVKNFLEEKVKFYFYTGLIDQIYNKIDPHPDFKGVEFKADFDSEVPRLDILVTNTLNQQKLIPNLYFSTAQINILSLSIFLATALNSKEYNCIFIDDPIQSMDSINVLSTIDLIRGIVATGEKQIILSTHDANFHNLLQKKIPPEMFKSRFLELETFGKVTG